MKSYFCFLLLLIIPFMAFAQDNCTCQSSLDWAAKAIRKSKSFKDQMPPVKLKAFQQWVETVKNEQAQDKYGDILCLGYLNKLIAFVKDGHNYINYNESVDTLGLPKFPIPDQDSSQYLEILTADIEGIYHIGRNSVLIKRIDAKTLHGLSWTSTSEKFPRGILRMVFKEKLNGAYEMFEVLSSGFVRYNSNVSFDNGRIKRTLWEKQNTLHNYNRSKADFDYKSINDSIDYISLKTFNRTRTLMKSIDSFYSNHVYNINKKHLIIDLRNNGGGSILQSKPLLKYLKKNSEIERIWVNVNCFTGSAAELTLLKLKNDKRTKVLGEATRGALNYGYGNNSIVDYSPCGKYVASLTRTKELNYKNLFEKNGVPVDIELSMESDWIEQTVGMINQQNNRN